PGEPAPIVRLEGLPHRPRELRPRPREEGSACPLERRPGRSLRVRRVEAAGELRVELVEGALVPPTRRGALRVERVSPRTEERLGAAVAHEAREALVERRLALQVQGVVGQLVDDRGYELTRVAVVDERLKRVRQVHELQQ